MISATQALLARTLVGFSQKQAAQGLGMAHTTLSNIENGESDPPASRLQELKQFYEGHGVEFLDNDGVRRGKVYEKTYYGRTGIRSLFDEIYEVAQNQGGEIYQLHTNSGRIRDWLGKDWYVSHAERMSKIKDNFDYRIIVNRGDGTLLAKDFATYRWFPEDKMSNRTIQIFGSKVCYFYPEAEELCIRVLNDEDLAKSMRELLNVVWNNASDIS